MMPTSGYDDVLELLANNDPNVRKNVYVKPTVSRSVLELGR